MPKKICLLSGFILLFLLTFYLINIDYQKSDREKHRFIGMNPEGLHHMFETYRDPATGKIPEGISRKVLEYLKTIPKKKLEKATKQPEISWQEAGPTIIGGRTRALAIDIKNPDIILAGGVSGGMWKSINKGDSWYLTTKPFQNPGVTALAQDTRSDFSHVWYYAAGEYRGNVTTSDRSGIAVYDGDGIYKSVDNGDSWELLSATVDNNPFSYTDAFDFVHRISISPISGSIFIANNGDGIYKSADDGNSFELVLGGKGQHTWNDVVIHSDGTIIVSLSQAAAVQNQNNSPGLYKSADDGKTWLDITPADFPEAHQRTILAMAESNPDIFYSLTFTGNYKDNGREDFRFYKHNLKSGSAQDRSQNLPDFDGPPTNGPSIHSYFNFTMTLGIKPDDEDYIVVGGLNLFRSFTGFSTPASLDKNITLIGGLSDITNSFSVPQYANHHVDNHIVVFNPSNPKEMWSGHDGGISFTDDCEEIPLKWQNKNHGYNVMQFYGVSFARSKEINVIAGGSQDNGNWTVSRVINGDSSSFGSERKLIGGDGSYAYVAEDYVLSSANEGFLFLSSYSNSQKTSVLPPTSNITPEAASNQRFIHPFAIDPNDEKICYYPDGNRILRNSAFTILNAWQTLNNAAPAGYSITAISASEKPKHILYYGASNFSQKPKIYRLDNSNNASSGFKDISIPESATGSYVHDIAINPNNADEIIVVFSNYNIPGLFHSVDGGISYKAIEGNLSGDNDLPGPSLRCAAILPLKESGETVYLVGTSAGLFSTNQLNAENSIWHREAFEEIGSVIVEHIDSRISDNSIIIGTHGRGIFWGDVTPVTSLKNQFVSVRDFKLEQNYPNPFNPSTTIRFTLKKNSEVRIEIFNDLGQNINTLTDRSFTAGEHIIQWNGKSNKNYFVPTGLYFIRMTANDYTKTIKALLLK